MFRNNRKNDDGKKGKNVKASTTEPVKNTPIDFTRLLPAQMNLLKKTITEMEEKGNNISDIQIGSHKLHLMKRLGKNPDTKRIYYEIEYKELARGHNPVYDVVRIEKSPDGRLLIDVDPGFISKQYTGKGDRGIKQEGKIITEVPHMKLKKLLDEEQKRLYFSKMPGKTTEQWMESSLTDLLTKKEKGNPAFALKSLLIFQSLLRAIQALHDAGVIHLDVKPANIMTDSQGSQGAEYFISNTIDFDISQMKKGPMDMGDIIGTLRYGAPELIIREDESKLTEKSDVYSLGMILFEMVGGETKRKKYIEVNNKVQLMAEMYKDPENFREDLSVIKVPTNIQQLIGRMTEINPDKRITLDEVRQELDKIILAIRTEATSDLHVKTVLSDAYQVANELRKNHATPGNIIMTLDKLWDGWKEIIADQDRQSVMHMFLNTLQIKALYGCRSIAEIQEKIERIYAKATDTIKYFEQEKQKIQAQDDGSHDVLIQGADKFIQSTTFAMEKGDLDTLLQLTDRSSKKLSRLQFRRGETSILPGYIMESSSKKSEDDELSDFHVVERQSDVKMMQQALCDFLRSYSSSPKHSREVTAARLMSINVDDFQGDRNKYLQLLTLEYHAITEVNSGKSLFAQSSEIKSQVKKILVEHANIVIDSKRPLSFDQTPFNNSSPFEKIQYECVFKLLQYVAQHETKSRNKLGIGNMAEKIKFVSQLAYDIYSTSQEQLGTLIGNRQKQFIDLASDKSEVHNILNDCLKKINSLAADSPRFQSNKK